MVLSLIKNKDMRDKLLNKIMGFMCLFTIFFIIFPIIILVGKGIAYIPFLINNDEVIFAIILSIKTCFISSFICLILGMPTALYISKLDVKIKNIIEYIFILPLSLPHLISGIALLICFGNMGIGGFLLKYFNFSFIFTKSGIILAQCFINLPLFIKIILMAIEEIDNKMIFVARTLGCNEFENFKYIVIPNLKKQVMSAIVMVWSRAMGEFGAVMMVAGTTRMKTEVMPTAIFLNISTGDINLAIGVSTILIGISILSLILFYLVGGKRKNLYYAKS